MHTRKLAHGREATGASRPGTQTDDAERETRRSPMNDTECDPQPDQGQVSSPLVTTSFSTTTS
jgi:hypothetical protein